MNLRSGRYTSEIAVLDFIAIVAQEPAESYKARILNGDSISNSYICDSTKPQTKTRSSCGVHHADRLPIKRQYHRNLATHPVS